MMIFRNIEFFNAAELESVPEMPGLRLQRFPAEVRTTLGTEKEERGRYASQASTGIEIRFVTDAPNIRISLSATVEDGDVLVYHGDYFHSVHRLQAGVIHTLHLEKPQRFKDGMADTLEHGRFSPRVWRILISRNCWGGIFQVAFHNLDAMGHDFRPPTREEIPASRWLAYGSSITHGSGAIMHHQAYIQQAARRLGVDVLNKGLGGSCFCERGMADYLIGNTEWDLITLELGINMTGQFSPEEFEARVRYLVEGLLTRHPGKPVVLISIYPNFASALPNLTGNPAVQNQVHFTERMRIISETANNPNLYFVNGSSILTDFSGLSTDLLHPSDYGHMLMGQQLAEALKNIAAATVP